MDNIDRYSRYLLRSVKHIFKKFLEDNSIEEIYETQARETDSRVAVEMEGTIKGELIIYLPEKTLNAVTKKFIGEKNKSQAVEHYQDVAGELANLVSGTFVNQMQYEDHNILLFPPEFDDDPIAMKTLYENINLSFSSSYGGFDVDLYFKEV